MMENELETMRRQMTLLKEKLDRQTIVTDKTLRETVCGVLSNDARHSVLWQFLLRRLWCLCFVAPAFPRD